MQLVASLLELPHGAARDVRPLRKFLLGPVE